MKMPEWLNNLITEGDNTTHCIARMSTAIVLTLYHGLLVVGTYMSAIHFDMPSLGLYVSHVMTMIGGGTTAVALKAFSKADAPGAPSSSAAKPPMVAE